MSVRITLIGTMFLGSMGMDFLFNPEVGLTQSHFYRNGGIKEFLVSPEAILRDRSSSMSYPVVPW